MSKDLRKALYNEYLSLERDYSAKLEKYISKLDKILSTSEYKSNITILALKNNALEKLKNLPSYKNEVNILFFGNMTKRQREIIDLITSGYSVRQVANELKISKRTVETHLNNVLSCLNEDPHLKQLLNEFGIKTLKEPIAILNKIQKISIDFNNPALFELLISRFSNLIKRDYGFDLGINLDL